jgi:hypothetical protein
MRFSGKKGVRIEKGDKQKVGKNGKDLVLQLFIYLFIFVVLGFELMAFNLSYSTSPIFVMGFFKIGSCKLFMWAGFEPRSS